MCSGPLDQSKSIPKTKLKKLLLSKAFALLYSKPSI
jgi:hypothetical protein